MPNGIRLLEKVQREYTQIYRETIEKYRNARCLWAVITHDSYIALTNPFWLDALGYHPGDLHYRTLYSFVVEHQREVLSAQFLLLAHSPLGEQVITLRHARGDYHKFIFWFSQWSEKESGVRVTYVVGIPLDE